MTEIPEHLLKRSRERRAAMGGDDAPASDAPAAAAPAKAAAASAPARAEAPKPVAPPPPKPEPSYVRAAKERRKIPFWAMVPLATLPVWAFLYVRSVQDHAEAVEGPRAIGATVYAKCSGCHGAEGGGGAGRQLNNGEVLKTFPAIEDQIRWIELGTDKYKAAGVKIYGNPEREGGVHETGSFGVMPGFGGELTPAEILSVVCYLRYDIAGADPAGSYAAEYEEWCSAEAPKFLELEGGKTLADLPNVGTQPKEGSATPYPAEG